MTVVRYIVFGLIYAKYTSVFHPDIGDNTTYITGPWSMWLYKHVKI